MRATAESWQTDIFIHPADIPESLIIAMESPRQGALQETGDLVSCNGVSWHTDTFLNTEYTALLTIRNDGFQLETHSQQFPCNIGEIVVFSHLKRHRLKAIAPFRKGMCWVAAALELDAWAGDHNAVEERFREVQKLTEKKS